MQKGFAPVLIILGIVLATVIVGGAYYYFQISSKYSMGAIPTPPEIIKQIQTSTPSSTIDETANWKTYTSTRLGFSFKYSSDAKITDQKDGSVLLSIWGPTQKENTEFYDGVSLRFSKSSLEGQTLKTFADKMVENSKMFGEILIPLKNATLGETEGYMFRASGLGEHSYILLPSKTGEFFEIINSTNDPTNKGFIKIADQILSTFKFN